MLPPIAAILPAAGKSSRFGGKEKKPFATIDGRAVWLRAAELFVTRPDVKQCIIVVAPEDADNFRQRFSANLSFLNIQLVEGGHERFDSIANALARLLPEIELVAIHDAVRPCTPAAVVESVLQTAAKTGAAIPAIPVPDTLKRVENGQHIRATVPRDGLWLAQTPQVFRKELLVEAYAKRGELKVPITDDAQLVEALGRDVSIVSGSPQNIKITTREDMFIAEVFLKNRKVDAPKPRGPFDDDWMK